MRIFAMTLLCAALSVPAGAQADLFGNSKKAAFRSQTSVLDRRARGAVRASVSLDSGRIVTPTKWGSAKAYDGRYKGQFLSMARAAAMRHGVPQDLFLRLVQQESGWNPTAKSHKGAIGLAQLMPETASKLGVNPHDPYENLEGGARYLAQQYRNFRSWRLALAAYNAGPGAVERYGGVPPYQETRNYVKVIWGS
ncbi:lytic transglycosylase domain-containing protein [Roseovarius amoyensis]|uniref:lytic transglycosylase domain-containing protein n=1 Tax=Roseovarius amoyensis TaxID=2211448 RepID=UPI000DBE21FC|nr:lytic transglycosylase domain-containing protein [Roseovarius amoyensis]